MTEWPFPPDFGDDYFAHDPDDIECRVCETTGLHWENVDGRWLLHDDNGVVHKCPEVVEEYVFDPAHGLRKKGAR